MSTNKYNKLNYVARFVLFCYLFFIDLLQYLVLHCVFSYEGTLNKKLELHKKTMNISVNCAAERALTVGQSIHLQDESLAESGRIPECNSPVIGAGHQQVC